MIGTPEILIICAVTFLIFGAGAIPKLARSIGKARNEFEKGLKESAPESNPDESLDGSETK